MKDKTMRMNITNFELVSITYLILGVSGILMIWTVAFATIMIDAVAGAFIFSIGWAVFAMYAFSVSLTYMKKRLDGD